MVDTSEKILSESEERLTLFPIKYHDIYQLYKTARSMFWISEEIDLAQDRHDWKKLTDNERYFISHVLGFFASSDTIVNMNIAENIITAVKPLEFKLFYNFQTTMEDIHSESYSLMIDAFITDESEKDKLFNAIKTMPCVSKKANWALKWVDREDCSFAERIVAFSLVEGVFFSSSFASIFWIKEKGILEGLCKFNEFISRDEGLHTNFAIHVYRNHITNKLDENTIRKMVMEAVEIETEFITESLPCKLLGMNQDLMKDYIRFVADWLITELGHNPIYKTKNPFPFMEKISLQAKQNFFEARPTEYQKSNIAEWCDPDDDF